MHKAKMPCGLDYSIQKAHRFTDISTLPPTYIVAHQMYAILFTNWSQQHPQTKQRNSPIVLHMHRD